MDFIENDSSFKLDEIITNNMKDSLKDLMIVFLCFVFLMIFRNLTNNTEMVGTIFKNETRFLLYISFIQILLLDKTFIVSILGCYFNWKINVWLFKKCKLYKPIILIGIFLGFYLLNQYYELETLSKVDSSKRVFPEKISDHLTKKKIDYNIIEINSNEKVNVCVVKGKFLYHFILIGDMDVLTENEFISILYHEIGHVVNNTRIFKNIALILLLGLCITLQIVFLRSARNIDLKNFSAPEKLFILECISSVFLYKFFNVTANLFTHYDEFNADDYSKKMFEMKYLATGLIKIHLLSNEKIPTTLLYNVLSNNYPSLLRRLSKLGFN
ncbi:hypothetical protein NGRA_0838 [Nosema granulosis]|uniref:Peptidase M48 domain-containing protein n=1 Tax=Nosema granulosis TaxID=83296 RepID=A0A9P6KZN8_9MICR|nr:hypothetical protein NGRA_0838 [Nosema granulosis]